MRARDIGQNPNPLNLRTCVFVFIGHVQVRMFHRSPPLHASKKQDHYAMLGVERDASQGDIKKAYYKVCAGRRGTGTVDPSVH